MNHENPKFEILAFGDDLGDPSTTEMIRARRVTRINVDHSYPPVTLSYPGLSKSVFRVKTLAELGAGFLYGPGAHPPELNWKSTSFITLGEVRIPIVSRIVYLGENVTGVEFVNPDKRTRLAIQSHFSLEFAAASLKPKTQALAKYPHIICTAYEETGEYRLQLFTENEKLVCFKAKMGSFGTLSWVQGTPVSVLLFSPTQIETRIVKATLLGFIKNIRGLNRRSLETMILKISEDPLDVALYGN